MKLRFQKQLDYLIPFDAESEQWLLTKKNGDYFDVEIKTPRNYRFHKKFFKLLDISFPYWKPEIDSKYGEVLKGFDQYREAVTIQAGYYEQYFTLKGEVRIVAKSISFAAMDEEEFSVFYDQAVNVIVADVMVGYTVEQIHELIGNFL